MSKIWIIIKGVLDYALSARYALLGVIIMVICLLFIIRILLHLLHKQKHKPDVMLRYKITNWYLTYFGAFLYLSGYIGLFMFLRFLNVNKQIDLKSIWASIAAVFSQLDLTNPYIIIVIVLLILLYISLWLLIFIRIPNLLKTHLLKLHLYYSRHPWVGLTYSNYRIKFKFKYSAIHVGDKVFLRGFQRLGLYLRLRKLPKLMGIYHQYIISNYMLILRLTPLFGLIGIFLYDCLQHNFVLQFTIYYLPFYVIFTLWYRLSFFLYQNNVWGNQIVYELCYCSDTIKYVNITKPEYLRLLNFIKNGLNEEMFVDAYWDYDYSMYINRRFVWTRECTVDPTAKDPTNYVFFNANTQKTFEPWEINVIGGLQYVHDSTDSEGFHDLVLKPRL